MLAGTTAQPRGQNARRLVVSLSFFDGRLRPAASYLRPKSRMKEDHFESSKLC
jgi:hypothetical protein